MRRLCRPVPLVMSMSPTKVIIGGCDGLVFRTRYVMNPYALEVNDDDGAINGMNSR